MGKTTVGGRETGLHELMLTIEGALMMAISAMAEGGFTRSGVLTSIELQLFDVFRRNHPEWLAGVLAGVSTGVATEALERIADKVVRAFPLTASMDLPGSSSEPEASS